jgi:outer membrane protein OmpA-like peptidoglycan-associated protein
MRRIAALVLPLAISACAAAPASTTPTSAPSSGPGFVVFFQPWSAAIDQSAQTVIAAAAKAAAANPAAPITVTGTADGVGSSQANVYLSETRSQVVSDALAADGIPPARIHQLSLGSEGPANTYE